MALLHLALGGCAGDGALSGRDLLAQLERDGIALPDREPRAADAEPHAELPPSGPITLEDLLTLAESRSPALAAARTDVGVLAGREWQAALYPNPRLELTSEDVSFDGGFAESETIVGVSQPIVIGNRLREAARAAGAERAAQLWEVEARRRELFAEIAAEHARLLSVLEQERLYGELRSLASQTVGAAQSRFEAGAAPERDVIRPRVELARLDAALRRLAEERKRGSRRLGLLVGGAEIDPARLAPSEPSLPPLESARLEQAVRSGHPSLLARAAEIEAAEARLGAVRAERVPDVEVSAGLGYNGERGRGVAEFGVGADIPIWDRRQGDQLAARFEVVGARQRLAATENELLTRLAEAVGEYEAARVQAETFQERIVPDAERAFAQTSEAYRAGNVTFLDMLDAQRTLADARLTLAALAAEAAEARAAVAGIVGPEAMAPRAPASTEGAGEGSTTPERPDGAEEGT